jgi:hypothetical protein
MFTIDQKITDLKVKEKNVLKILFSMNIHQVASPEMILEEARSYVLFFREGKARISVYIALHLLTTDRKLYYSHSSNPFPEDELSAVEEEALGFAEGLGAMLDVKDFTKMSDSEQDNWIDEQDIFSKKPLSDAQPTEQPVAKPAAQSSEQPVVPPVAPQPPSELSPVQSAPQPPPTQAPPQPSPVIQSAPEPQPAPIAPPVVPAAVVTAPIAPPVVPAVAAPVTPTPQQPVQQAPVIPASLSPRTSRKAGDYATSVKPAPLAAAARQQAYMQQSLKAGISKAPKQASNKQMQPAAGVVSRDREALARLLTSF